MTILLSEIYDVTLKRGIEGAAKNGFIRPTIGENFMTHRDFEEIARFTPPTTVGEFYGGGYYMGTLGDYYLICAPIEGRTRAQWKTTNTTTAGADSLTDGYQNTANMITAGAVDHPAANFCNSLTIGGFTDWYLPSKDELNLLYQNHLALEAAGAGTFAHEYYWSSSEISTANAWFQHFYINQQSNYSKVYTTYVRAIRRIAI